MQSRTSYSKWLNKTLFRKNLVRFWPLWAVYTVIWFLILPGIQFLMAFGRSGDSLDQALLLQNLRNNTLEIGTQGSLIMAAIFGVLFAMALCSYLTTARSVGMFHSFPIRREGVFLTNYLSGVAVFGVAQVVCYVLTGLVQAGAGGVQWYALGVGLLCSFVEMLFFFSFAVFCAMFTGQILAIPAFYVIFNGLALVLCNLVQSLASAFYYGYSSGGIPGWVRWLTPIYKLNTVQVRYEWDPDGVYSATNVQNLSALAVYAVAALVLAAIALAVYRRRLSETAGDTVAVRWAKPIFLYGVAACLALSLGQGLYYLIWSELGPAQQNSFPVMLVCVVLLGLVGYFAAAMLLRKSFRVIRATGKGALVLVVVLVVLGAALRLDVLGVVNRVPDLEQVEYVTVHIGGQTSGYGSVEDPETIEKVIQLHAAILEEQEQAEEDSSSGYLDLEYHLKNGGTICRNYYVRSGLDGTSRAAQLYTELATDPGFQRANMLDGLVGSRLTSAELSYMDADGAWNYLSMDAVAAQELYQALVADIDAGNFGVTSLMEDREWAEHVYINELTMYYISGNGYNTSRTYMFNTQCENLIAALEEVGALSDECQLVTYLEAYPEDYEMYEDLESTEVYDGDLNQSVEVLDDSAVVTATEEENVQLHQELTKTEAAV